MKASRPTIKGKAAPSQDAGPGTGVNQDRPGKTLVSRRKFLYGVIGVGAVAAVGAGAFALNAHSAGSDGDIDYLDVPESALTTLADFDVIDSYAERVHVTGTYDLPYGTLVWVNDDSIAACLLPTETGSPLTQIGILSLSTGNVTTILEKPVGSSEHFEVYDVRATSSGMIWTEANVLEGTWRIYATRFNNGAPGNFALLEEGDSTYDTPMLAAVGTHAYWQVLPKLPNDDGLPSRLMTATFGSSDATCAFESSRRMGTPPYSTENSVVITPRVDSSTVYYQLTNIDAESGKVVNTLTLPSAMHPLEAGFGRNGFMFSFSDIYNYGGAIANLGTYTPFSKPSDSEYGSAQWFGFARTPTAAPAWCENLLIVKSSYSVCGVDLDARQYFAIDVDNGADTYGEYLASSGTRKLFVTYTNVDHKPVNAKAVKACRVKVWAIGAGEIPVTETNTVEETEQNAESTENTETSEESIDEGTYEGETFEEYVDEGGLVEA